MPTKTLCDHDYPGAVLRADVSRAYANHPATLGHDLAHYVNEEAKYPWERNIRNSIYYMVTEHVGRVLYTGEMNGYDDSDFYAMVWDDDRNEPRRVMYATTRRWTYPNSAVVDAPPDLMAKYADWQERIKEQARQAQLIPGSARKLPRWTFLGL